MWTFGKLLRAVPENNVQGGGYTHFLPCLGGEGPVKIPALGGGGISAVYGNEKYW